HVVFFNLTEMANGETRALQPKELYRTQQYATAIYRAELAARLQELGYETERGRSGQPEVKHRRFEPPPSADHRASRGGRSTWGGRCTNSRSSHARCEERLERRRHV